MKGQFDEVVVVTCEAEIQRERLKKRDGLSDRAIDLRLASQMSLKEKEKLADLIVINNGSIEDLIREVEALILENNWKAK